MEIVGKPEDSRIEAFLRQSTEGLKPDPELRLEVIRELRSHIDANLHEPEIATDDDPVGAALKAMGSPVELAGPLQQENSRRMSLRGLARFAVRAALLPAALLLSVWLLWDAAEKLMALSGKRQNDRQLIGVDELHINPVERYKSEWEHSPNDPVFFAGYVLRAASESENPATIEGFDFWRRIDPENALFPYVKAAIAGRRGLEINCDGERIQLQIRDEAAVERFHQHVLAATGKRHLNCYRRELMQKRLEILNVDDSIQDVFARYAAVVDASNSQHIPWVRKLALSLLGYAEHLKGSDRGIEAAEMVKASIILYDHLRNDAGQTLIDWVPVMAVASVLGEYLPGVAEDLPVGDGTLIRIGQLSAISRKINDRMNDHRDVPLLAQIESSGGFMAMQASGMATGLVWDPTINFDLTPGRWLDYILLERLSLVVFLTLSLIVGLACIVRYGWMRWRRPEGIPAFGSIPLLLLPHWKRFAMIVGCAVLFPFAVYFAYSRWMPLAGRDLNVATQIWRFGAEQVLLWIIMFSIVFYLTRRFVRSRCRAMGVNSPVFFQATLMRSAAPILAAVSITAAVIAHPYLKHREAALLQADTMMQIDPNGSFSQFESSMVAAIRETVLTVAP